MKMKKTYNIPVTGRPNAGKTSLINYLTRSKRPVGKHAGTTLRIAPIALINDIFLVDLPGFGKITKRSKKLEDMLKDQIVEFLENPENSLFTAIHIIDISTFHIVSKSLEKKGIIPLDIEMIQFLGEILKQLPFVLLNKIDKVTPQLLDDNIHILESYPIPNINCFTVSLSSEKGCRIFRNELQSLIVNEFGVKYQKW
jgi:GTP-binding protein EngB required for normal cell division